MRSFFFLVLLVLLTAIQARAGQKEYLARRINRHFFAPHINLGVLSSGTFNQLIDHSRRSTAATFKQRFFIDRTYAQGPDSPVFYYICGEGACSEQDLGGALETHAQKYHAVRVALEHRYYGMSQPFQDSMSAQNLRFLTIENALKDLASFQDFAVKKFKLRGKWIAVGGSYPGSLSAYYRLMFPNRVVGALASSAPVQAKASFEEYDLQVATAAGPRCASQMRAVVQKVEAGLQNPSGRQAIKEEFGGAEITDDTDFLYVVADMAAIAIQYGFRDEFCRVLEEPDPVQAYADEGKKLFSWFGITPLEDSAQGALSEDPKKYESGFGMRQWLYQSCRDFGYFQVAYHDPSVSVRSASINMGFENAVCQKLFGMGAGVNVDRVNQFYYQPILQPSTQNIYFTNGSTDPWAKLSITKELGNNVNPFLSLFTIEGSAHCEDLGQKTSQALTQARQTFDDLIAQWLK